MHHVASINMMSSSNYNDIICTCSTSLPLGCTLHSPSEYLLNPQFTQTSPKAYLYTPSSSPSDSLPIPNPTPIPIQITYSSLGDPLTPPDKTILVLLPSSCSRWVTAFFEPIARVSGLRIIAMDRPGVEETRGVELKDRVRVCTEMTEMLLKELGVRPGNILVASCGIIYLWPYLLGLGREEPLPKVWILGSWSPPLDKTTKGQTETEGDVSYTQMLTWIPTPVIMSGHKIVSPNKRKQSSFPFRFCSFPLIDFRILTLPRLPSPRYIIAPSHPSNNLVTRIFTHHLWINPLIRNTVDVYID